MERLSNIVRLEHAGFVKVPSTSGTYVFMRKACGSYLHIRFYSGGVSMNRVVREHGVPIKNEPMDFDAFMKDLIAIQDEDLCFDKKNT